MLEMQALVRTNHNKVDINHKGTAIYLTDIRTIRAMQINSSSRNGAETSSRISNITNLQDNNHLIGRTRIRTLEDITNLRWAYASIRWKQRWTRY